MKPKAPINELISAKNVGIAVVVVAKDFFYLK